MDVPTESRDMDLLSLHAIGYNYVDPPLFMPLVIIMLTPPHRVGVGISVHVDVTPITLESLLNF